jgi:hypothetical protein
MKRTLDERIEDLKRRYEEQKIRVALIEGLTEYHTRVTPLLTIEEKQKLTHLINQVMERLK